MGGALGWEHGDITSGSDASDTLNGAADNDPMRRDSSFVLRSCTSYRT